MSLKALTLRASFNLLLPAAPGHAGTCAGDWNTILDGDNGVYTGQGRACESGKGEGWPQEIVGGQAQCLTAVRPDLKDRHTWGPKQRDPVAVLHPSLGRGPAPC